LETNLSKIVHSFGMICRVLLRDEISTCLTAPAKSPGQTHLDHHLVGKEGSVLTNLVRYITPNCLIWNYIEWFYQIHR